MTEITLEIYRSLGLTDALYRRILKILGRQPSLTELAMFSVEWSEHCGYLCSRKWLKLLPKRGRFKTLIGEDSGGIIVDDLAIIFKMESHNHPSQVEPKQGAATGIGGIIRDIFTAGARPIALMDSLRFGELNKPYNRYLLKGVVDGIQFYGNCVGVPTVGGEIYFEDAYTGNCLVNVMCVGVGDKNKLMRARAKGKGNAIIYAGASTGRDGIGGCSVLASAEFGKDEEKRPTVQIGDPFMEKCLIEATLEAIATGYVVGIKDMGAAGLTCSTSEMASSGGVGVTVDLKYVPRREENMQPWEIMMSESQERMLLCVKKGRERVINRIFSRWGLNSVVIGRVTDDNMVRIKDSGKTVACISAEALTSPPMYDMPYREPGYVKEIRKLNVKALCRPKDYNAALLKIMASPTIANKHWVYEQYDHMVQTNTVVLPGAGDSAVLRLKGSNKAIAVTTDCSGRYCYLDPFRGSQIAVAEAARNLVCVGARPAAITDCLNFGNPQKPDRFWQFKNCVQGITDACRSLCLSVVSGNVSFYNENPRGAIYPTPTIGMIGVIDDLSRITAQAFKRENELVILLGKCLEELGGSEYLKVIHKRVCGRAPGLNLDSEARLQKAVLGTIKKGLVSSAHDCSEGGLAVALAECCVSRKEAMCGADIDNLPSKIRPDALLFGESQSRIIISAPEKSLSGIKQIAKRHKIPLRVIGRTTKKANLRILSCIDLPLEKLHNIWYNSLESLSIPK
ncbi:MAG: phosphoribosylformylglycinamidine synthase subunit PurL [Candidatus Omnitrophota bacterium]